MKILLMRKKGFTLIELLVVIAIIGLLGTLSVVSFSNTRAKSRDVKRKQDLITIQKALELYYQDNGAYPITSGYWGTCVNGGSRTTSGVNAYIPNLTPTYISNLPTDPTGRNTYPPACGANNDWACYVYNSNGTSYKLLALCTGETGYPSPGQPFYDPVRPIHSYAVCNMGSVACTTW